MVEHKDKRGILFWRSRPILWAPAYRSSTSIFSSWWFFIILLSVDFLRLLCHSLTKNHIRLSCIHLSHTRNKNSRHFVGACSAVFFLSLLSELTQKAWMDHRLLPLSVSVQNEEGKADECWGFLWRDFQGVAARSKCDWIFVSGRSEGRTVFCLWIEKSYAANKWQEFDSNVDGICSWQRIKVWELSRVFVWPKSCFHFKFVIGISLASV